MTRLKVRGEVEDCLREEPSEFFKHVKSFVNEFSYLRAIHINGKLVTDPVLLCGQFGKYFSSNYQPTDFPDEDNIKVKGEPLDAPTVTTGDAMKGTSELNYRTSIGADGISPIVIGSL